MRSINDCVALAVVLGGLVAVCGCSSVSTTEPIGEPATIAETNQFVGAWVGPEGETIYVKHVGENRLRLASVSWDDEKSEFKLEKLDCLITKDEDQFYANLLKTPTGSDQAEEPAPGYTFGWLVLSDTDQLLFAAPKVECFAQAVRKGAIDGQIEEGAPFTTVSLKPTANQLTNFVTPSKAAEQFALEEPLVLRRTQRFEDKQK